MNQMSLSDGPVVLTNLSVLIQTISDILHDIDREKASAVVDDIDRASSLLSLASDVCVATVAAIEACTKTFCDWDDFDRTRLIQALMPAAGGAA